MNLNYNNNNSSSSNNNKLIDIAYMYIIKTNNNF